MSEVITLLSKTDETVDDGSWFDIGAYLYKTVQVLALTGAGIIQLRVSEEPTKPLDSVHGLLLGTEIAAGDIATLVYINNRHKWLKAYKETGGGGTGQTKVYMVVHRESPQ
jgi:hypothetical protein